MFMTLNRGNGTLNYLACECHQTAKDKGWWDGDLSKRSDGELIALMHSELSEALEASRHGNPKDKKVPEFGNMEVEFADCIIRILDMCTQRGLDIEGAIQAKMEYNKTRSYRHGNKKF